jgi:hypothetical protein
MLQYVDFYTEGAFIPSPYPQARLSPPVGRPQLPIQCIRCYPPDLVAVSSVPKLRLQSYLFPSGYQPKLHNLLLSSFRATCPTHLIPLFTIVVIFTATRYDIPNNVSKFHTMRRCQPLAPSIQIGGPPPVGCSPLIFKYTRSQVTYVEATTSIRHLRMRPAAVTGTHLTWGSQPHIRVK